MKGQAPPAGQDCQQRSKMLSTDEWGGERPEIKMIITGAWSPNCGWSDAGQHLQGSLMQGPHPSKLLADASPLWVASWIFMTLLQLCEKFQLNNRLALCLVNQSHRTTSVIPVISINQIRTRTESASGKIPWHQQRANRGEHKQSWCWEFCPLCKTEEPSASSYLLSADRSQEPSALTSKHLLVCLIKSCITSATKSWLLLWI